MMETERCEKGKGRPLKWPNFDEFQTQINDFFDTCDREDRPYTITGLAIHLGTNRMTLHNVTTRGDYDDRYIEALAMAKQRCELWLEESLLTNRSNVVGAIFSLKNNFGWKDKTEKEVTVSEGVTQLLEERRRKVLANKVIDIKEIEHNAENE